MKQSSRNFWKIFGVLSLLSSQAIAGARDSGGLPEEFPIPNEDFTYECALTLRDQYSDALSKGVFTVTQQMAADNNGGMGIEIPEATWRHGTQDRSDSKATFVPTQQKPSYNLEHHFFAITFSKNDEKAWQVSLRASAVFKDKVAGAAAFARADFTSNLIEARVIADDPTAPTDKPRGFDFIISCIRK